MDNSPPGFSVHGFSRQEYWSGLLFVPSVDLPNPGIKWASCTGKQILYHWPTFSSVQFSSVAQSCLTLCDPMDCSLPGSSVHGFSRQEYWSGLPFPSPGDLSNPGIEPDAPALQKRLSTEPPGQALISNTLTLIQRKAGGHWSSKATARPVIVVFLHWQQLLMVVKGESIPTPCKIAKLKRRGWISEAQALCVCSALLVQAEKNSGSIYARFALVLLAGVVRPEAELQYNT